MLDSKNQPYVSGSSTPKKLDNGASNTQYAAASDTVSNRRTNASVVEEPEFLNAVPGTGNTVKQNGHLEYAPLPPDMAHVPRPEDSTVQEPQRARSLRLQLRYLRVLIYAAWLFARILFWQVYVDKYVPGYVRATDMNRWRKYAREYRGFAAQLGGVFIKLGQFISTRVDILPEEIVEELASLQDEVPTIPFERIRRVLEQELGPIDRHFAWVDEDPVAAASLGQVHRGRLRRGDRVVVKVQRPEIRETCFTDLAAMKIVAKVAMRFRFIADRADAVGLVKEFGDVLLEELSYRHEAYNAARFSHMFKNDMGVYIPAIYYDHSTDRVLTMEDVTSIKITDYDALDRAGIKRKVVADRLMDTYMHQIFHEHFFHADPHPGNLFVYPLPVEDENADFGPDGRPFYLIFVDFGMTGSLTREIADGMVSTLHAVLTRDVDRLIDSYSRLGFLRPGVDQRRIKQAVQAVFDEVWGLSMSDLRQLDFDKMADIGDEFYDLIFSMPVYIPQDFIYLGRTISILSGMATGLEPNYNPWQEMQPHMESLIARGFGIDIPQGDRLDMRTGAALIQGLITGKGGKILRNVGEEVMRRTFEPVTGTVNRTDHVLQELSRGEIQVVTEMGLAQRQQMKRLERLTRRNGRSVFLGSVLISSTILYTNGDPLLGGVGLAFCGLIWVIGELRD